MRMMLLVVAILMGGCAASKPAPAPPANSATNATPSTSKELSCAKIEGCYDSAKSLCDGKWHQVARPGEPFPYAEPGADKNIHMLVACGEEK